uniref:DUF4145 domain-containing protein n=1 Tax=uncultured Candidatus Melainabacteria bacterium TaxID=2682970 RepID=A0A650EJF7_9BACT|nr:hypothetical protein Melaina855_0630 [uncultured Candidatus Melainabacteria bacterium]
MLTNFDFLKNTDKNLYEIISDAEMLYRDEYFEQCMGQTRRFAENVCKNVLGKKRTTENTFDQMLATLKDNSHGSEQEKEFIEDLYFLKKCGNQSVHSSSVKQNGIDALECLQRAFEVAINYSVYNKKASKENLNLHFDVKLLATGKRDKNLAKKYAQAEKISKKQSTKSKTSKTKSSKQQTTMKSCPKENKITPYWIAVSIFSIIAFFTALFLIITK